MAAVELPLPPMYADADIVTAAIELKKLLYNRYTIEVCICSCWIECVGMFYLLFAYAG